MSRILISGASGLIGSALAPSLEARGNQVIRLVRRGTVDARERSWDPMQPIAPRLVSGYDTVIHLSGENVAGRWTESKKERIRDSRVVSTQNLAQALAATGEKPEVFLCASAIGYYGNRGNEILTEASPVGTGFLPEVCCEWEAATVPAADAGIRVVNLRTGIVLSRLGGALKQMLLPFRLGLGGRIGSGRQWWSWIHIDDLVTAVEYILQARAGRSNSTNESLERRASPPGLVFTGAINLVSPNPVTNAEFTKALARALHRPAIIPMPAFAARLAFKELADEALLASARVVPKELIESGFQFRQPELEAALRPLVR